MKADYVTYLKKDSNIHNLERGTAGFTLTDLLVSLALISILVSLAIPLHLDAVERAKALEASEVLSEVVRLEHLHYVEKGTYTSDLQELGFQMTSSLKYTELFIEVHKDAKGWSYMAFAWPLYRKAPDVGGWAAAQHADGSFQANLPGSLSSGGASACSVWRGWRSMEGGHIEGEESLSSWSSSSGAGGSPCGRRVVFHGKK
jgi:Tfp pilus assembly protein PilE